MTALAAILGVLLLVIPLWDAYETILLPRRMPGDVRISRLVLRNLWKAWSLLGRTIAARNRRELFLSFYAQLSLIVLFVVWASGLILGFALLQWSLGSRLHGPPGLTGFPADLYLSGSSFFTLGLGDVAPASGISRFLTVLEAGIGFSFLALVIAYVPVLYQSFSRREARITMLDAWGGSPPTAGSILRRAFESKEPNRTLDELFRDWEMGSAEILESHLSYPTLAYFRSQHDSQSWLASISAVLDTSALVSAGVKGIDPFQARLTFALCRHTLVDIAQTLGQRPAPSEREEGARERLSELRAWLARGGVPIDTDSASEDSLRELRELYRPYATALAEHLIMPLPPYLPRDKERYRGTTAAALTAHDAEATPPASRSS